jgi:hypothetical protein
MSALQHNGLLPAHDILQHQIPAATEKANKGSDPEKKEAEHGKQLYQIDDRMYWCKPLILQAARVLATDTVSGRTISRHRRQPDQNRYNTTHKSRSHRWRRKRRGAFFWQTASWWRSARISACRAARVRKLEATKAKKATKRELIVVATMISRMVGTPAFSDRTEFSVCTRRRPLRFQLGSHPATLGGSVSP